MQTLKMTQKLTMTRRAMAQDYEALRSFYTDAMHDATRSGFTGTAERLRQQAEACDTIARQLRGADPVIVELTD
jgi:hypothetical protein